MNAPTQPDPKDWAEALQGLQRADEDMRLTERIAGDPDFLASAAFHCHQAAEKMAKAIIVAYRADYPRIHDLAQLGIAVSAFRAELGERIASLKGLTDWYFTPRYPGLEYHPSREDVELALGTLKELRRQIDALAPAPGE
jgi:HEPN domain-containing protein